MGFFDKIGRSLGSRSAHWKMLYEPLGAEYASAQKALDANVAKVFLHFNWNLPILLDALLSPDRDERLLSVDIREIQSAQFRRMAYLLMEAQAGLFVKMTDFSQAWVRDALRTMPGAERGPSPVLRQTLTAAELDLEATARGTWEQILAEAYVVPKSVPLQERLSYAALAAALSTLVASTVKALREEGGLS